MQPSPQANTTLCGLTVGVTVILELPIFHYSDVLLKRMSQDAMFMVAILAYIIRVYGYTLLTPETVWYVLLASLHVAMSAGEVLGRIAINQCLASSPPAGPLFLVAQAQTCN